MTQSDPTGYRDSPDTSDGPVGQDRSGDEDTEGRAGSEVPLTTDSDAQHEDSIMRPGNEPD